MPVFVTLPQGKMEDKPFIPSGLPFFFTYPLGGVVAPVASVASGSLGPTLGGEAR